ncbi:alpha/beta hydrolase [Kitasatospora sp. NPDC085879]|uniref:alpha/beta hydrolase n=1 Tax=Kitasatospora sp. NPDC085879 TaxID=3154769 RepID=UPI003426D44D
MGGPRPGAVHPAAPAAGPESDSVQGDEQGGAVLCGDSPNPRDPAVYHELEEAAAARAGDAGCFWTWAAEPCSTWPAQAADRYSGPWNNPTANTVHDPSTPYTNAQAMAKELANARLLTNNGYGHTVLFNPTSCIQAHESRYLVDGTLPPPGTVCEADTSPFSLSKPHGGVAAGGGGMAGTVS